MENIDTQNTPDNGEEIDYGANAATYCPEDDKLRLYVGRVPKDEYLALRAEGWLATPKQDCDFAAVWNVARRDRALKYAGFIGDEDQDPADRAADRAERFAGYRDKRTAEATGYADNYDSQPIAHGFQSEKKAERAAARHDRLGDKATDQWSKAEYWKSRTAGVIAHALHRSAPDVRMGRIKVLEADLRKLDADHEKYAERYAKIKGWAENPAVIVNHIATRFYEGDTARAEESVCDEISGYGKHRNPANPSAPIGYRSEHLASEHPPTVQDYADYFLRTHHTPDTLPRPNAEHLKLRIAYEHQMLEAQGGRAAMVEMEAGGFIGSHQITKVTRSPATGRVVSVEIEHMSSTNQYGREWSDGKGPRMLKTLINIERMGSNIYRAPTDEERTAYAEKVAAAKKANAKAAKEKAAAGENCPLINPTDEDAERLQALWNEKATECGWCRSNGGKPSTVLRMTQASYSELSKGSYSRAGSITICEHGTKHETRSGDTISRHSVFKIRATSNGHNADRVIVITDKPQKQIPWGAVKAARAKEPTIESLRPRFDELNATLRGRGWTPDSKTEEYKLMADARYCGLWFISSMSQFGWTPKGMYAYKAETKALITT